MADLAKMVGVSTITVSRALADSPLVNPETRSRIQALAKEHGYAYNINARNLRLGRSNTVAVVIEMAPSAQRQMSGPYPLALLGGIIQELTSAGYSLLLTALTEDEPPPGVRAADGVILLGQGPHERAMHTVREWGRPLVVWGAVSRNQSETVIGSDNVRGGQLAAERFLALGRGRPAFVGDATHGEFAERLHGFSKAFAAHGVTPLLCDAPPLTIAAGSQAVHALLQAHPQVDAIFAASDLLAIGAVRAVIERGRRIPEEVSVIGFDDSPMGATYVPPLTSIHQDFTQAGALLAKRMLEVIDGQTVAPEVLPTQLVVRAT